MTLTKAILAESIRNSLGFTKQQSIDCVETLLDLLKKSLGSGDDVLISGFGKFCIKEKNQRRGRNPATGGHMILDARKVVTFKCSRKLKDKINR